jgi:O-antigen/teichoic acid export membrane protein
VQRWDDQQQGDWSPYWDPESTMTMPHLPMADGRMTSLPAGRVPPRRTPAPSSSPTSGNWLTRIVSELRNPLYRGGYLLVANTAGTSIIGAAYWAVAAHLSSPEELGRATALISALMLVSTLSQLNLSSTLTRFLPRLGARTAGRLINFSYMGSTVTALIGGVIFVVVAPRLSSQWSYVGDSYFLAGLFILAVIVWELFTLQDAALVGLQRAGAIPIENVVYGLLKLILLVAGALLLHSTDVLASWTLPLILLIPVINWLMFRRYLRDRHPEDRVAGLKFRHVARFASVDYAGLLFSQITGNFIPLLVMSTLGATANGSFYIAGIITSGAVTVGLNFSTGLMVEGSASPDRLAQLVRGVLRRVALTMVPGTIVLILGARLIARIYGASNAAHTATLLQVLAISLVPVSIQGIAFSIDRIHGKPGRAALGQLVLCVLSLGGSWLLLGRYGVVGVAIACVGADIVVALVRVPTIVGAIRPRAVKVAAQWAMPTESVMPPRPPVPAESARSSRPPLPAEWATPPQPPAPPRRSMPAPSARSPGPAEPAAPSRPAKAPRRPVPAPSATPSRPATPPRRPMPAPSARSTRPPRPAEPATPPQPAVPPRRAMPAPSARSTRPSVPAEPATPPQSATPPRRPGPAEPASPPQPYVPARLQRPRQGRSYAGRHRAPEEGESGGSDEAGESPGSGGPRRTVRA